MFSASHRGGSGPPLLLLHGFTDTWRTWELVLPELERHHEVLAPTLPGHAGGAPLPEPATDVALVDWIESVLDDAGWERPHVAGNSMGAYLGLLLAERERARSLVALAPAGGWAPGDDSYLDTLAFFEEMQRLARQAAPHADRIMASPNGRRSATQYITVRHAHLDSRLLADQLVGAAACDGAQTLIERGRRDGWRVDPERIRCPVRFVWGGDDRILEWPRTSALYRQQFPHAEWIELDGVGHCPQLDVPRETAQLILGLTAR